MHIRKMIAVAMAMILSFSFSVNSSAENLGYSHREMALKMLVLCHQARVLLEDPDHFAVPIYPERHQLVTRLHSAVGGKESIGYIAESASEIYIVFRGTVSKSELKREMCCRLVRFTDVEDAGHVHHGFFSMYSGRGKYDPISLRQMILFTLSGLDSSKKLYITGFSMGAALATMCAVDVANNSPFKHPAVYTFASSKVGDKKFVRAFNEAVQESVRIVNRRDVIPWVPFRFLGGYHHRYHHVKGVVFMNVKTGWVGDNHRIITAYFPGLLANVPESARYALGEHNPDLCPRFPHILPKPSWKERNK